MWHTIARITRLILIGFWTLFFLGAVGNYLATLAHDPAKDFTKTWDESALGSLLTGPYSLLIILLLLTLIILTIVAHIVTERGKQPDPQQAPATSINKATTLRQRDIINTGTIQQGSDNIVSPYSNFGPGSYVQANMIKKMVIAPALAPQVPTPQSEYSLQRVDHLAPSNYRLFHYLPNAYVTRETDTSVRDFLRQLATSQIHTVDTHLGICIIGRPAQGKTRLAWEAMQSELAHWTLVHWPHVQTHPFDFAAQRNQRIILWLDDLHEFANPSEAVILNDLPRRFIEAGAKFIIVATCRDGEDQLQAQKHLGSLLERLVSFSLPDISLGEALDLAQFLTQGGVEVHRNEFDGTPGSLVLGVLRMQGRYLYLTSPAQNILKTIKLLRSIRIYTYPEERIRTIAHDIFGLDERDWRMAYESLDREGFIKLSTFVDKERMFEPIADIYVEEVISNYPTPHATLVDDWMLLKESFQRYKDAGGLLSLGLSAYKLYLENQRNTYPFTEECYNSAAAIYLQEHDQLNWAGTLNNLGLLFLDLADQTAKNQAIKLINAAIETFNEALTVFSQEDTPAGWVMVQNSLGLALNKKAPLIDGDERSSLLDNSIQIFQTILMVEESSVVKAAIMKNLGSALSDKAVLIEKDKQLGAFDASIQVFQSILEMYSHDRKSLEWADAQSDLGVALSRKVNSVSEKEEKYRLLNKTAQAHADALTIYSRENNPVRWANMQYKFGTTLSDEAKFATMKEQGDLLKDAIGAYRAALMVYTKEIMPLSWAKTQSQLGDALYRQALFMSGKEQSQQFDEVIQAYNAALEVYNKTDFSPEWTVAQNRIGKSIYHKAILLEGAEQNKLLEDAIRVYHKILETYTQESTEPIWIDAQENLGISLHRQAQFKSGKEQLQLLNKAIQAYNAALKAYNKAEISIGMALTQINLGIALRTLIPLTDEQERQALLDDGIKALRDSLQVYTRNDNPSRWAEAQHLLGTFLLLREGDPADTASRIKGLEEAIQALHAALEVYTKEATSIDWARTQFDLGVALITRFELLTENIPPDLIFEARQAFHLALEVYSPKLYPDEWFTVSVSLAKVYHTISLFISDKDMQITLLHEADRIVEPTLTFYKPDVAYNKDAFAVTVSQQIKEDLARIESISQKGKLDNKNELK